ncbi:MAG TPA: cbb3-type cytochrome c oxidase subunit II [Burkholderiales bacterium]|nr:cbb3-type cytochrome c oxidase subunit II [Burkholderiales bacterium]
MKADNLLITGALVTIGFAALLLMGIPYIELSDVKPPKGLKPYTSAQLRGRQEYIGQGCMYCHSQQPRARAQSEADAARGWGRASVAGDYYYDKPQLLGSMRTGPDLFNIGARQPSADWHLGHLYQPRAYVQGSIMPPYGFLFDVKDKAEPGERVVNLPPEFAPKGKVVVATPRALDLVAYLIALDHTYPAIDAPQTASR